MREWLRRRPGPWAMLAAAVIWQGLLLARTFAVLVTEPNQHLFTDRYDGAKNYFTFQAYLQQPFERGLLWFGQMNYPFGDYIFYTDNSPLLAVGVKLFSRYVYDLTPRGLDVYNGLLVGMMLLSTVLLVSILRRLLHSWVLIVGLSVMLPWLSPQLERLTVGHLNLSLSWVVLLGIWGLQRLYEHGEKGRPLGATVPVVVAGQTAAAFLHLYYLPIVGLYVGSFLAFWLLSSGRWRQPRLVLAGAAVALLPLLISFGLLRSLDGYYALRVPLVKQNSYDGPGLKLSPAALVHPYAYNRQHFPLESKAQPFDESTAYLGLFALWALLLVAGLYLLRRPQWQAWWRSWRLTSEARFVLLLLAATGVGLLAALGTRISLNPDGTLVLNNYLSVFYHLDRLVPNATHFRAVARFSWPFFWALHLLLLVGLDYWLRTGRSGWRWAAVPVLVLLAWLDTRDALKHYRHATVPNTISNPRFQPELTQMLTQVNTAEYQAILPIPYFHVGSEGQGLTIDDADAQSRHAYFLALRTGLPLLASKMSRTPHEQARQLLSLLQPGGPVPALKARLAGRPILVLYDDAFYRGDSTLAANQPEPEPRRIVRDGAAFIARHRMPLLAQAGTLRLYRWELE
ncbi:hypothetical protein LJ737_01730 [Hymenobacter sp. 15J16-1T3B]|uniref:SoxR reducing system RseC family protein n=1 Tax=Hymenobacter sp. 15J16-1T3B TaxID=2886941 RepID=UPI001D11B60A|nr:hypothetical protein [Hymenobacter sp. 15J16-1T3B]MCC3155939.1 hypothetical protein [Hymenobacter sp. 15J16-1T3B]